jgi:ELWxxDGT repeat protein
MVRQTMLIFLFFIASSVAADKNTPHPVSTAAQGLALAAEPPTVPQVEFVADISVKSRFVEFGDWLYFDGSDASSGDELWSANEFETTLVKDINPGNASSSPKGFTPYKGYLYFSAYEESTGRELWRTNGVETTLVKDFVPGGEGDDTPGSGSSDPGGFTEFNGWLNFKVFMEEVDGGRFTQTNDELWRTNGIDTERFAVLDSSYVLNYRSYELAVFDGNLYFSAREEFATKRVLWRTNGIDPPELFSNLSEPALFYNNVFWYFTEYDGYLYFAADDGVTGTELRRTDGFETELVEDINQVLWSEGDPNSGTQSSLPQSLTVFDGYLYFKATDDINGFQLWRTDGVGTSRMTNFPGRTQYSFYGLTAVSDSLYFTADDVVTGREVWKTDGFDTILVADVYPGGGWSRPTGYYEFAGFVYLQANDGSTGAELFQTDGVDAVLVADINPGGEGSGPWGFIAHGDFLYFGANNGLWRLSA